MNDLILSFCSATVGSSIGGSAFRVAGRVYRVIVDSENISDIIVASQVRVCDLTDILHVWG